MASRIFALLIWAAVAASTAFWGLRWWAQPTPVPTSASQLAQDSGLRGDIRRVLKGPSSAASAAPTLSASAELAARIKLLGVVAPREGQSNGVALVSVDGKPSRAVRLGKPVDGELVLLALKQRGADFGPSGGPVALSLELPAMVAAATGTLGGAMPTPSGAGTGVGTSLLPQVQSVPPGLPPTDGNALRDFRGRPPGVPL